MSLRTFFVPNAVPTSIRLADSIPGGRLKLYHGIYAIAERNLGVVSLDPRDAGLTRKQLKKRLLGLADFGLMSPSIPLITERSRARDIWPSSTEATQSNLETSRASEKPYACTPFDASATTRTIRVANGDGTFREEAITSVDRPTGSLFAPDCVGLPLTEALLYGNHSFVGIGIDYLTGRIGSSLYQMYSRLDTPL